MNWAISMQTLYLRLAIGFESHCSLYGLGRSFYFSQNSLNSQGLWHSASWSQLKLFSSEPSHKSLETWDTLRAHSLGRSTNAWPAQWLLPFCRSWELFVSRITAWRRWLSHALYDRGSVMETLIIQESLKLLKTAAAVLFHTHNNLLHDLLCSLQ